MPLPGETTRTETSDAQSPYDFGNQARMAQFTNSDDTPTDTNYNAVIAREQSATLALMGKNFEANAMRFNGLMSHKAATVQ